MKYTRKGLFTTVLCILLAGTALAEENNILRYGSCDQGPKGWYTWQSQGSIKLETAAIGLNSGKGLQIVAEGESVKGSVSMPFSQTGALTVSGYAASTTTEKTKIVLQSFDKDGKTVGWIDIAHLRNDGKPSQFSKKVTLPANAKKTNLAVVLTSSGAVLIDDLSVSPTIN